MGRFVWIGDAIDRISDGLAWIAKACLVALIAVMLYEVVARYVFGKPTLWTQDIAYMLNGALFLFAVAFTLRSGGHVRVDFLSSRFAPRTQDAIQGAFFLLVMLPALGALTWVTARRFWRAFESNEPDPMSSWAPPIWPFYLVMLVGFASLFLQVLSEVLRHARGVSDHVKRG
jgi:TRAP-type mannitol/chloroaromatic compound transport system permease small subunit